MPQKKDERMHGMAAFQGVAAEDEPALVHFLGSKASLRGGL
jgi:hypothetical protein